VPRRSKLAPRQPSHLTPLKPHARVEGAGDVALSLRTLCVCKDGGFCPTPPPLPFLSCLRAGFVTLRDFPPPSELSPTHPCTLCHHPLAPLFPFSSACHLTTTPTPSTASCSFSFWPLESAYPRQTHSCTHPPLLLTPFFLIHFGVAFVSFCSRQTPRSTPTPIFPHQPSRLASPCWLSCRVMAKASPQAKNFLLCTKHNRF